MSDQLALNLDRPRDWLLLACQKCGGETAAPSAAPVLVDALVRIRELTAYSITGIAADCGWIAEVALTKAGELSAPKDERAAA